MVKHICRESVTDTTLVIYSPCESEADDGTTSGRHSYQVEQSVHDCAQGDIEVYALRPSCDQKAAG